MSAPEAGGGAVRPGAIRRAEWLYLAAIGAQPVLTALIWPATVAAYGAALAAGDLAFTVGVWLLLLLLATRRGSGAARVVLLVLTALLVGYRGWQLARFGVASGAPNLLMGVQAALMLAGAALLLAPEARAWFAAPREGEDEDDGEEEEA